MKRPVSGFLPCVLLIAMAISACSHRTIAHSVSAPPTANPDGINDLCLIYQGGSHRIDWTKDDFRPYVSHRFADGHREWTFDGFLFLEIRDDVKQMIYEPGGVGGRYRNSTKEDWLWYLDRLFEPGKALDALNSEISDLKKEIGDPGFRHKLVLTVLPPCPGEKNWGELDGRRLDFSNGNFDDMALAGKWFVDTLINRYSRQNYENLDLVGLYWLSEDVARCKDLSRRVADAVHDKGLTFYWIPYYKAPGYDHWRELGFDVAYHQPNHFFSHDIPDARIDSAITLARAAGLNMEFEFDSNARHGIDNSSHSRMQAYIDRFVENGVYNGTPVAYYTGSYGLIDLDNSGDARDQEITDQLFRIIADRRRGIKIDESYLKKNIDLQSYISGLSLEQKARLLVGDQGMNSSMSHITPGAAGWTYAVESAGIPSVNLADGPVGVRINPVDDSDAKIVYDENGLPVALKTAGNASDAVQTSFCTAFPSTSALAATWDKEAAYTQGVVMGDEARCYGVDVILSPGINIIRNPLCGRNFEYYSEDPVLGGKLASEVIKGIQSQDIGTSLKHFVANNQQTGKKFNDARISQRALREIYLKGFEICVKEAHPWTVMGSYNKIAGEYTQTNQELLKKLLRDEWGFDGLVLTDWTVRRPTPDLLNARCALMMPGEEEIVQEIMQCVNDGSVSQQTLDECVADVLGVVMKSITKNGWEYASPDLMKHAQQSRRIASEGMVLLKNNDDVLPLKKAAKVALFGASAYKSIGGGTGSSNVNKPHVIDIDRALAEAGFKLSTRLSDIYNDYDKYMSNLLDVHPDCPDWQRISYHRTVLPEMDIARNRPLIADEAAANDIAVIVVGRGSGETSDRVVDNDFNLTREEQDMISAVSEAFRKLGKPVVVVLNTCGTIEIVSWRDKADAILCAWLPGQECGYAVADVLDGTVNPSGRLPMTFPVNYSDMPSSQNYPYVGQTEGKNFDYTNYAEDIWVGYRYFHTGNLPVAYPFGYGLSYTDFRTDNPRLKKTGDRYYLSVDITNTGSVPGREVVQLYVKAPDNGVYLKPLAELKAFAKTSLLAAGETERITLDFTDYDLASFDEANSRWLADSGVYELYIGLPSEESAPIATLHLPQAMTWNVGDILRPVEDFEKIVPPIRK